MHVAAFLDRDGTLILDRGYCGNPDSVQLEDHAVAGLNAIIALGYLIVVVSNQSGIGRGLFHKGQVDAVNERVDQILACHGLNVTAWYYCPHAPDQQCECRKPAPGMLKLAAVEHEIDLARSIMIGDKLSDLEAARSVGARPVMVRTGEGRSHEVAAKSRGYEVCENLLDASVLIANPF